MMTGEAEVTLEEAVVEAVKGSSRQGQPATREDVLAALADAGLGEQDNAFVARVEGILDVHPGISAFAGVGGELVYHDPDVLSATYARIMDRKGSPLALMAEEIRLNSRNYPRPVPVELFEAPPFDLSQDEIRLALKTMAASKEFEDISYTATASEAVYLFSTLYLERQYADFLAERAENLSMNP